MGVATSKRRCFVARCADPDDYTHLWDLIASTIGGAIVAHGSSKHAALRPANRAAGVRCVRMRTLGKDVPTPILSEQP